MAHDLIIKNGRVIDGTGMPAAWADVAISDGRIAAIGKQVGAGRRELDASGCVVTPGFIDGHTHMDAQVMWDPSGSCSSWHGVTTVVMGNCGFTLAPTRADRRDLVVRNLERAEDISAAAMAAGIDWTWQSFPQYLDAVEAQPKAINYAANIGHSALRTWAMGDRAFDQLATEDDLALMEQALLEALEHGAIGFTTSRSQAHETAGNQPVASRAAAWSEIERLVCTVGRSGHGVFEMAHDFVSLTPGVRETQDAVVRAAYWAAVQALAVASGVPFTFGVFPAFPSEEGGTGFIDASVAAGARMFGQSHCRGVSVMQSFKTSLAFDHLPEWREVRALPLAEQQRRLHDAGVRQRLVEATEHATYGRPVGPEPRKPDYDLLHVFQQPLPPNPTLAELARERRQHPVEVLIDLALASDLNQLFFQPLSRETAADQLPILKHPRMVMTFSDSGAHVSQIIDSSLQTYFLAHWVRQRGDFTLEEAVRMLTLVPATAWGFHDRGLVRPGFAADLNVFDPDQVGPAMPTVDTDLPAGAKRLKQRADGFVATVVGGEVTLLHGESTGAFPGQLLRSSRNSHSIQ